MIICIMYSIFNSCQCLFAFLDNDRWFKGHRVWNPDMEWSVAKACKVPPITKGFDVVYTYGWIQSIDFCDVLIRNTLQIKKWTVEQWLPWNSILKEKDYFVELVWTATFWVFEKKCCIWTEPFQWHNEWQFPSGEKKNQICKTLKTVSATRKLFSWINPEYSKSNTVPCSSSPEYLTNLLASALERHQGVLIFVP